MDISSLLGTVLSADSIKSLSKTAGVPASDVQKVLGAALPSLLNGAVAQSRDSATAESFAGALSQHSASDTSDLSAFLGNVDLKDGSKIVGHLLGSDSSAVVQEISQRAGVSTANTSSVMSAAAPLLMSLLGQETNSQQQTNSSAGVAGIMGALIQNVDMGSLITGLLGGTGGTAQQPAASATESKPGGILGVLGNLLK